jgi:hypothetical protein
MPEIPARQHSANVGCNCLRERFIGGGKKGSVNMLKIYKTVRRAFDVTVISLKRYDAPLRGKCQDFRCTCCSAKLGDRGWGLAWINDGKGERSARLCFDCTEDAAAALAESQATVNQQPQVETADTIDY